MITGQRKMRGQLYFSSVTLRSHSRLILVHTVPAHKEGQEALGTAVQRVASGHSSGNIAGSNFCTEIILSGF